MQAITLPNWHLSALLALALSPAAFADDVLYECGFEPPQFIAEQQLVGLDGWMAFKNQNAGAAKITAATARSGKQSAVLDGSVMQRYLGRDYFAGWYYKTVPFAPLETENQVLEFSIDVLYVPGSGGTGSHLRVELYDSEDVYVAAFTVEEDGEVGGFTEETIAAKTTVRIHEWNHLAIEVDYRMRTAAFKVNGTLFGWTTLDPAVKAFNNAELSLVTNSAPSDHLVYYDNYRIVTRPFPTTRIIDEQKSEQSVQLSFYTYIGYQYTVQYTEVLDDTSTWSDLPAVEGTGELLTVSHTELPSDSGFYRVRVD